MTIGRPTIDISDFSIDPELISAELEKKFLPNPKAKLPEVQDQRLIHQFYLNIDKLSIRGGALYYYKHHLYDFRGNEEALVRLLATWDKPPKPRIRIQENGFSQSAFLTLKADLRFSPAGLQIPENLQAEASSISNLEFERQIDPKIAEYLMRKVGGQTGRVISKTRGDIYVVTGINEGKPVHLFKKPFEVDFFHGPNSFTPSESFIADNKGLTMIELEHGPTEDIQQANLPNWIGIEVTKDPRFTNSKLAQSPLATWEKSEKEAIINHKFPGKSQTRIIQP